LFLLDAESRPSTAVSSTVYFPLSLSNVHLYLYSVFLIDVGISRYTKLTKHIQDYDDSFHLIRVQYYYVFNINTCSILLRVQYYYVRCLLIDWCISFFALLLYVK